MSSVDSIRHGVVFQGPICILSVSSEPLTGCWIVVLRVRVPLPRGVFVWHETRDLALPPALAGTPLAKRSYDLRHSALSTWLCAGADPAEVAQRAGNSVEILLTRYAKCLYDRQSMRRRASSLSRTR
jgi:hypothetical protein